MSEKSLDNEDNNDIELVNRNKLLSHHYWSPVLKYDKDGDFIINFFWNNIDLYFLQPIFNYAPITGLITTKEHLDVQIWRERSHNTDGSTTSWRSRIQFPLQLFSYYKQQLALTSTSTFNIIFYFIFTTILEFNTTFYNKWNSTTCFSFPNF
jgi:hypothetical protein